MGNTQSLVRYLAPASFLFDFGAQQYGIFSRPNMLDIHNGNLAAFSPYPYAIAGFFFPQQLVQLAWLWKLWRQEGCAQDRAMMTRFAWVYSLGNVCIGTWMFFWNANNLKASNVFVVINTVAQLGSSWGTLLGGYAAMAAGIVALKNYFYPRWKAQHAYEELAGHDDAM